MDLLTLVFLGMSFFVVLVVTWTIAEPLLTGTMNGMEHDGVSLRARSRDMDSQDLREDFLAGKIERAEFERLSAGRVSEAPKPEKGTRGESCAG